MNDKKELIEKRKSQIAKEMMVDKRYKDYFDQYNPASVESFIQAYANEKAGLEVNGDYTKVRQQSLIERWQKHAWACLKDIQYKKLFDLACQWHAEEIRNLPDIEMSMDFTTVQKYILDYEALPDITQEEVDFYINYLTEVEDSIEVYPYDKRFSSFKWIKEHYENHGEIGIEYFDHHNTYTGNNRFLSLPDLRSAKEKRYMELGLKDQKEHNIEDPGKTEKPYLFSDDEEIIKFARQFNDRKFAYYMEDFNNWIREKNDLSIHTALDYLNKIYPDIVAVGSHSNWQDEIYDAAIKHMQNKVCEILPAVYQEYLMKKNAGIIITREKDRKNDDSFRDMFRQLLFKGRELSGESRDFNF